MKVLAISGSVRKDSINSMLLRVIQRRSQAGLKIEVYEGIGNLPIFNPDLEGDKTPDSVLDFCMEIDNADGILIACPEYVRSIPGGLKNSIDWLVSRQEIISKPIALAHASYRGDDMLKSLRIVLNTVSENFAEDIILKIPLNSVTPVTEESIYKNSHYAEQISSFLTAFSGFVAKS